MPTTARLTPEDAELYARDYFDSSPVALNLLRELATCEDEARQQEIRRALVGIRPAEEVQHTAAGPGLDPDGPDAEQEPPTRKGTTISVKRCPHALDNRAVCTLCGLAFGLDVEGLHDSTVVSARGRAIAEAGIPWVVDGIIPAYGMLGFLVAFAKVGKTTLGHAIGAAVSSGSHFIGRKTAQTRVLYIAAEDPPEYTDYLARSLVTQPDRMTFYERNVILNDNGLAKIAATVRQGSYGLVLIASWQAVIRGLVKDENDNAGAVLVTERVKAATRETKIPWLIDAHSGRGEDQGDEADPTKTLRGASSAAGAADYILSLRYADGAFGTKRRISGRGRFVTIAPQTIEYDIHTGSYEDLGATKSASADTTWRLILETGAITQEPRSVGAIALAAGLASDLGNVPGALKKRLYDALHGRDGVTRTSGAHRGKTTVMYSLQIGQTG